MRRFFTIVLIILTIGLVQAQDDFHQSFHIGVHSGISYGNVRFKPSIFASPVQMQDFGLMLIYESEPHLGLQLEANISQKGWQSGSDSTIKHTRKMRYLEFPLLTHISVGNKLFRFHVNIGPYIAFYRESVEGFEVANSVSDSVKSIVYQSFEYQEQFGNKPESNFDFGFTGGVAFGFHGKFGELALRVRYSQGLTNLFPQYPKGTYRFSQVRSMYAGVSYAVVLHRKKAK